MSLPPKRSPNQVLTLKTAGSSHPEREQPQRDALGPLPAPQWPHERAAGCIDPLMGLGEVAGPVLALSSAPQRSAPA